MIYNCLKFRLKLYWRCIAQATDREKADKMCFNEL